MDTQGGMSGTTQQLFVTSVLEFGGLFYPDYGDPIDGLQLSRLIHSLKDDLRTILEAYLHWGLDEPHYWVTLFIISQVKVLSQFLKQ